MASPVDIITYIGVPLAVLGVLPILYNFVIAFFIRLRLKRQLKSLGLLEDTIFQSRFMNGVVELDLPVYDLEIGGCPNVRARFRSKHRVNPYVDGMQGGSWTGFDYCDSALGLETLETHLERSLAGRVTKGFQISSKLSLPESSVRFENLLGYCFQIYRGSNVNFESTCKGFKALKDNNLDVPVDTKLLSIDNILPFNNYLELSIARSSLENRGSLCLRLAVPTGDPSSDYHAQDTLTPSKDDDYFSAIEIAKWAWLLPGYYAPTWDKTWIVKGTNRYFIREPSPPALDQSTTQETRDDPSPTVSLLAGASESQQRSNVPENIDGKNHLASEGEMGPQTTREEILPAQCGQSNEKSNLNGRDPEDKLPTVVTLEEDILAGQAPLSTPPCPCQIASTTTEDHHNFHPSALTPRKGFYIWINSDEISQVFSINGLGPNDEPVGLKQVDIVHDIMEPIEGLGVPIQLNKKTLESRFLKHAFAAYLELENSYRLPKFEYQAEVLYAAVFSSIDFKTLTKLKCIVDAIISWSSFSEARSFDDISATIKCPLRKESVRELEAVIDDKFPTIRKENETRLFSASKYTSLEGTVSRMRSFSIEKGEAVARRIQLSVLRRYLDLFLWKDVCLKEAGRNRDNSWPKTLSQSKVPTVEEILYWILCKERIASNIIYWLEAIGSEYLDTRYNVIKTDPISFFCAIILVDEVAKKAEKFMLIGDIQHCLKRFPRVYIK